MYHNLCLALPEWIWALAWNTLRILAAGDAGVWVIRAPKHARYRDTSPIRKDPPPEDHPRTLGGGLRLGPWGLRFLMSEVPM